MGRRQERANFAKHGFDFERATQIFDGPVRENVDPRPWGEERVAATGYRPSRRPVHHRRIHSPKWAVSHLSARPARRSERF